MEKYRLASLFAGIGGIDLGFQEAGVLPIWANEIDKFCEVTFRLNHPNTILVVDDINNINSKDIPDIEILGGGFPCQSFSIAGHRKGFDDDRGNLFFQIIRIVKELEVENRKPKVIFLENVKNLYNHNNNKTYSRMKEELNKLGYFVKEEILNTCLYGNIPQNRERLYVVAFLDKKASEKFEWPKPIHLENTIDKFIDWENPVDKKYYYNEKNKCHNMLKENVLNNHSIYQYRRIYIRENKSKICPTLTANMGMGGHNVPIIKDNLGNIRKLTPKECLSLQGFPDNFIIPKELCDSRVYKQAGNSVSVPVIKRIAEKIVMALNEKIQ